AGVLRHFEVCKLWQDWRQRFSDADGLSGAMSIFNEKWLPLRPMLRGTVLILDQFEELFTRLPAAKVGALFEQSQQLLLPDAVGTQPRDLQARNLAPVHLAFSLRKEFLADLVPRLRAYGPVDRLIFFLGTMTAPQARAALGRPAALFGINFAPARAGT